MGERPDRARRADPSQPPASPAWRAGSVALGAVVASLIALPAFAAPKPKKPEPVKPVETEPAPEPEQQAAADETKADAAEGGDAKKSKWDEVDAKDAEAKGESEGEAEEDPDELAWLSAGVDLHSKYMQRGQSLDANSEVPALQPYFEIDIPFGFWLGYWGSTVTYGDGLVKDEAGTTTDFGFENDFMAGWGLEFGEFSARLGGTYFYFQRSEPDNAGEVWLQLGWEGERMGVGHEVTFMANVNVYNHTKGRWANNGDAYLELIYNASLPKKFIAGFDLGWNLYRDEPEPLLPATNTNTFSHLILKAGREIVPHVTLAAEFLISGWDRDDVSQLNALMWVVSIAK